MKGLDLNGESKPDQDRDEGVLDGVMQVGVKLEVHLPVVDKMEGVFDSFRTAPESIGGAV